MLVVRESSAYLLGRGELEVEHRLEVEPHAALGTPVREARVERAAVSRERLLGAEAGAPTCSLGACTPQWCQRPLPGLTADLGGLANERGAAIAGL